MAELVDARDLKSLGAMLRVGSSPTSGIGRLNGLIVFFVG